MTNTTHRVWKVGSDVDTDQLAPGAYMKFGIDEIARHCLQGLRPDFAASVQAGDVLAAGENFGIGSSREQAASALVALGLSAVVASSYSGLYFRNAFNVGLLLLTCPRSGELEENERITIALDGAVPVVIRDDGSALPCEPIPGFLLDMVRAGGLLNQLKHRLATGDLARHPMKAS